MLAPRCRAKSPVELPPGARQKTVDSSRTARASAALRTHRSLRCYAVAAKTEPAQNAGARLDRLSGVVLKTNYTRARDSRLWSYLVQDAQRRVERFSYGRPPDGALERLDDHGRHALVQLGAQFRILRHVGHHARRKRVLNKRVSARRRAQRSFTRYKNSRRAAASTPHARVACATCRKSFGMPYECTALKIA